MPIPCPQCATESRDGDRFCRCCGCKLDAAPLAAATARHRRRTCRHCGAANKPSAHFCSACGMRLASAAGGAPLSSTAPPAQPAAASASAGARGSSWRIAAVLAAGLLALALAGWYLSRPAPPALGHAAVPTVLPTGTIGPQHPPMPAVPPSPPTPVIGNAPAPIVTAPAEASAPAAEPPAPLPVSGARARRVREAQRERAAAAARREPAEAPKHQRADAEPTAPPAAHEPAREPSPAATRATTDSVQALCSARGNLISEQLCRNRECRKPEFAGDAVCVRLRELQDARQQSNAP